MQTIKTAVVVVLLLGVCYGAYVALNAPEPVLPPELEAWSSETGGLSLDVEDGAAMSIDIPQLSDPSSSDLNALTPPQLSPLDIPGSASPNLPQLEMGKLETPTLGSNVGGSSGLPADIGQLSLPPDLEGSSVPLPGNTAASSLPAKMISTGAPDAKLDDNSTLGLPGFPLASNDVAKSTSPLPSLAGDSATSPAGSKADGTSQSENSASAAKTETAKPLPPFKQAREEALKFANDGKLREALAKLSAYYNHIDLTREEHLDLVDLLDALAGEVIYSKRHLLEPPFIVNAGETLESIANRFHISPETLAKINMMGDSKVVLAGAQLKVLNGPMRAEVNLTRGELTLFLNDLYAGRFPISVGNDPAPFEGTFEIIDRRRDRTYYGANSPVLPSTDGRNPYGGYWMSLGQELCIHGSPTTVTPELSSAGCISLAPLDAQEVYSLLAHGSQVRIYR